MKPIAPGTVIFHRHRGFGVLTAVNLMTGWVSARFGAEQRCLDLNLSTDQLQHADGEAIRFRLQPPMPAVPAGVGTHGMRGFLVGLTNPKTLLFYGAFFPQFVTPGPDVPLQLLTLAVTFLAIAIVLDEIGRAHV